MPHGEFVEVRGQLARVLFLLPLCETQGSSSGLQALPQGPLPAEPSHWPSAAALSMSKREEMDATWQQRASSYPRCGNKPVDTECFKTEMWFEFYHRHKGL